MISERDREKKIEDYFTRISKRYDLLNHLLSFGIDIYWRKKLADSVEMDPVLDLASGTGDVAYQLLKRNFNVFGLDISMAMLRLSRKKIKNFKIVRGSALNLPFKDNSFGWITVAFGLRNFPDPYKSLLEMKRVIHDGGGVSILEFALPERKLIRFPYLLYFRYILPLVGKILSDGEVYEHLPNSVLRFPKGKELVSIMEKAGFRNVSFKPLSFGIVGIYKGYK